jgi:hypothetical protein
MGRRRDTHRRLGVVVHPALRHTKPTYPARTGNRTYRRSAGLLMAPSACGSPIWPAVSRKQVGTALSVGRWPLVCMGLMGSGRAVGLTAAQFGTLFGRYPDDEREG